MDSGNSQPVQYFWLGAGICALLALWALYRFLSCLRRDRLLADTPLVRIRSAAQGYVKLCGRAAPAGDTALSAPLSSRPCVWWRYEVEQKTRNSKGEARWESIENGSSVDLFTLADADAQCLVGPVTAEITPTIHDVWYGHDCRPNGPPSQTSGLLQSNYRYTESLLCLGDQLSVVGELRSHSEVGNGGAGAAELLQQWKQDQPALLARFDQNHDGKIDAGEWEAVRLAAVKEAQSHALKTPITRMSVISQPTNGEPFLIAAMDDAHLVRREKLHAAMFLGLGLGCVALCAWAVEHARSLTAVSMASGDAGRVFVWLLFVLGSAVVGIVTRFKRSA